MEPMGLIFDNQKEIVEAQLLKMIGTDKVPGKTGWMFGYRINPVQKDADGKPIRQLHNGVDLPNAPGYPIRTPWEARVLSAWVDTTYGGGNSVVLEHQGEAYFRRTGYAHMIRWDAATIPGAILKKGTIIGYVGSTGLSTGAHLHFTGRVMINNVLSFSDPLPQICGACGVVELPIHQVG